MPESAFLWCFWSRSFFIPAQVSAAWTLSLLGAVLQSLGLLAVCTHRAHPTCCVLSSALQTSPGSGPLPRDISVWAGAKEQLRQALMRTGVSVPFKNREIHSHVLLPTQPTKSGKLKAQTLSHSDKCYFHVILQKDPLQLPWG